jgi:hypothetical protein
MPFNSLPRLRRPAPRRPPESGSGWRPALAAMLVITNEKQPRPAGGHLSYYDIEGDLGKAAAILDEFAGHSGMD